MTIPLDSVGQVAPSFGPRGPIGQRVAGGGQPGASFKDTLAKALGDVQEVQENAESTVQAFLRGEHVELHDVMAAVEEAGLALEMLIEVRNKMTEAYRTVTNMQS